MDFLQMKHLKRKRKSNYSVKETQTLIREIHKRREILFSRQQNMAINELKRRAWEEVADSVNSLGEGELRTAAEVKRRYLDWRALMKRKQLQAELASGLKQEFEASSPDNDASLGGGDQSLDLSGFSKDSSCDWQDLTDLGEPSTHTPGVKMEDDEASSYRLEAEVGEGGEGEEDDEDCFPSILPDMDREGRVPEVFAHIDEFGVLSSTKPSSGPTPMGLKPSSLGVQKTASADVGRNGNLQRKPDFLPMKASLRCVCVCLKQKANSAKTPATAARKTKPMQSQHVLVKADAIRKNKEKNNRRQK